MTIAAERIEFFARELAALGCRVTDERRADGSRQVLVSGAHWFDTDNVIISYTPGSAKGGKGRQDTLFCTIFSKRRNPRKGYARVTYRDALRHAEGLKDYSAHTHCEPGRHVCGEPRCTTLGDDGKACRIPESLHRPFYGYDHCFTQERA